MISVILKDIKFISGGTKTIDCFVFHFLVQGKDFYLEMSPRQVSELGSKNAIKEAFKSALNYINEIGEDYDSTLSKTL